MKTYNTYEMLKELMKNPDKRFQHVDHSNFVTMKWGILVWMTDDESDGKVQPWTVVITDEFLSMKWEEKEKEVPWQEAIRAWCEERKGFRVDVYGETVFQQQPLHRLGLTFDDNISNHGFEPSYFKYGKWYIED